MKKLLLTTFVLSVFSIAQATVYLPYDEIDTVNEHLVVYKDNQSGVIDKAGQLSGPLRDGAIVAVFDDVIITEYDRKIIFTDKTGKVLLETKPNHTFKGVYNDTLLKIKDDHWSEYFVDHQGNIVEVKEDEEVVYKNRKIEEHGYDKYTLVDATTDKVLVPVGKYEVIREFNAFDLAKVEKDYNQGFIDLNGNEVIPCIYSQLKVLDMGYIAFETKERLWGLMDKNGKIILKAQYDGISNYTDFSKDIAIIRLGNREGFLDKNLTEIIPPKYHRIELVSRTKELVELTLNGKKKIINKNFEELFAGHNYDSIEGHYTLKNFLEVKKGELYGLFTTEGKEIIPVKYSYLSKINDNFIKVMGTDKKFGVYDFTGKLIIPVKYESLWYFDRGNAFSYTLNDGDKGIIDATGKKINVSEYEDGFFVSKNVNLLAVQNKKGNWGLIDSENNTILDFDYADMRTLSDDKLLFRKKSLFGFGEISDWGVMDLKGNVITEPSFTIYKSVIRRFIPDNLLAISFANSFNIGFLDKDTGKIVIKPQYVELLNGFTEKEQQYLFVNGRYGTGVLNLTQQKELVPPQYDNIRMLDNGFFKAYKGDIWSVYDIDGVKVYERKPNKQIQKLEE